MPEATLFGIAKSHWDMINGFANWFAAAGSFAAAAVALYVANRAGKPTAILSVGCRIIVGPSSAEPYPEFVVFRLTNTGDRPIRIINIGWRAGFWRKKYVTQTFDPSLSDRLPLDLSHAEEGIWYVPLAYKEGPWPEYFVKTMLYPISWVALWTLRARALSSVGIVFVVRPENELRRLLKDAFKRVRNS
jgi:hypothetical protein